MKTIVFDFFGVICSEIAPFVLPKYMAPDVAVEFKRTVVHDADLGKMSQAELFATIEKLTGAPAKQLEAEFYALVRIDGEVVELIESLRQTYRVGLLTNAVVPFVRDVMAEHKIERLFDTILVSAEEGLAKPDPAYYARMLERMSAHAGTSVMIDDNPDNLVGARAAGMDGILYESCTKLKNDLAERYAIRA
ncbi:MAG: HAD family phosphatase [Alphaproteobacteria bacterium]|nr:HAD family phosphatase [Alphaproteobacteria bacterium]MDE2110988.1 HAD family phosphatase [Alphaproteobacteria bacterium]MDE2493852.1 HAD family phosphatase [Alphaproteobacteria bacterium]